MEETGSATTTPAAPESGGIFSFKAFRRLFFGSLIGAFADRLYFTALITAAYVIYLGRPVEDFKGQIQIYATIPLLILYSIAGSLIDGFDRRRLLVYLHAVKAAIVLLLAPLLWSTIYLNATATAGGTADAGIRGALVGSWPWCLGVVVLLNIVTVPFGPARASAVPDVVPERHRSMGASLLATAGLLSLLLAALIGGFLARTDVIGPALTIVVASGCYVIAALLMSWLPDAVAVPGNKRPHDHDDKDAQPASLGVAGYVRGLWNGVAYCCRRLSILGLIFFESCFWTIGSAFYILMDFHARTVFQLNGNNLATFSGVAMGMAGIGLFGGAIGVGRICSRVSPLNTYAPAFLLLSGGLYAIFHSPAATAMGGAPIWIYPVMFLLGLGGGALLGRVDADVLAISDVAMRGRVFSIKAVAFAATILVTIVYLSAGSLSDTTKEQVSLWLPRIMFMLIPLAFIFSWAVDVAIWVDRHDVDTTTPLQRFGYRVTRGLARLLLRIIFRYEIVGAENIPESGPVILAANHASFIDPLFLGCATRRVVQYTMYASYYRSFAHPFFRLVRCISVDEANTLAALKANVRALGRGACVGIFPEGRVSLDGNLTAPQGGTLFLAQRSGALVVPVAIKGNYNALPRHAWIPRFFSKVTVIIGKPITVPKDASREQTEALTYELMQKIADTLGQPPPPKAEKK